MKRILNLLLLGVIFFSSIGNVYAKSLTINEVSNEFVNTTLVEGFKSLGSIVTSKVDSTNKTLDIYSENEKVFSFKYSDDYIEYNNRDAVVTKDNCTEDIFTALWIQSVMESVFRLSGYEDKTLSEDGTYTDTYDTYGVQLETEHYNFSGEDEDGGSWSMSGDYVKYFKISLDTDKIDSLITKYGVDMEEQDPNKEVIANLTPTLQAKNITENSVTLYPHINYTNTDPDYMVYCYVYRSTSENGTYEKISDMAVNCLDEVGVVDENLNNNTTYYYKALVVDGTKYSDIIQVTTKEKSNITVDNTNTNNNTNNNQDDLIENPKTGVFFPTISVIGLSVISIGLLIYIGKKKNFFIRL